MKDFFSSHVLRDLKLSCLSPSLSPSLSFPSMHRPPWATANPQLCLALGIKTQWWGQHKEATPVSASRCQERGSKLHFQKGERKDTELKEKLYKLPRGEQDRYQDQPKPGPQRGTKGRISLPWLKEKLSRKLFRSPPSRVAPGRSRLTDLTVNEHCYQVPGICFVYSQTRQKDPGFL